jgi:type 1 glutamine amidotransferase
MWTDGWPSNHTIDPPPNHRIDIMSTRFVCLYALLAACLIQTAVQGAPPPETGDYQSLFNGRDLTGWEGNPGLWSVKDGAITGVTRTDPKLTHNTFIVYTKEEFGDFDLRFSYRIVNGNSGVQYRSRVVGQGDFGPIVGGYQADFEAGKNYSGILYEERGRGILAKRGEKTVIREVNGKTHVEVVGSVGDSDAIQAAIRHEDWNDYVVVAQGNRLQQFINGLQTVDVLDEQPGKAAQSGVIALQIHTGPAMTVQFKNLRIKQLRPKRVVLIPGSPSHGRGDHEHQAGCLLFAKCLSAVPGVEVVTTEGWPTASDALEGADAIVIYSDGGGGHPAIQGERLAQLGAAMEAGAGLGCIHYAVEVPKDRGGQELLNWIGGYFEAHWSVNPFWVAEFTELPDHPVTRGVRPFKQRDEWYYHMRFQPDMKGVTPILSALPPASTLERRDGPHSNNPHVRKAVLENKEPQHVMWAYERPDGGRGFGFTGGHSHSFWGNDDFRKVVLNAILWIAKAEVPPDGVDAPVTAEDLELKVN